MNGDDELIEPLSRAVAPSPANPDAARVAQVRRLANEHLSRRDTAQPPTAGRDPGRRTFVALAAVAAAAVLVAGGAVLGDRVGGTERGREEFDAALAGAAGAATVEGELVDTGRIVRFDSDDLPVLPKGEFYELWFLAPGDDAGDPRRISAGTFHPDEQGRAHVTLFAAVDPTVYGQVEVTAEPGDGDPDPAETPVLTGSLRLR